MPYSDKQIAGFVKDVYDEITEYAKDENLSTKYLGRQLHILDGNKRVGRVLFNKTDTCLDSGCVNFRFVSDFHNESDITLDVTAPSIDTSESAKIDTFVSNIAEEVK